MKKYILGMAKSVLNLKGAKSPKVELDLLRLLYAVQNIKGAGDEAYGCICIIEDIKDNISAWLNKYDFKYRNHIIIHAIDLTDEERLLLTYEKNNNTLGINASSKELSSGKIGEDKFEGELFNFLVNRFNIQHKERINKTMPYGIRWDFSYVED